VHGILTSDLMGKTIHCHVVKDGYAARVKDSKSYDMIRSAALVCVSAVADADYSGVRSKDILSRWTYPLVPDENNPSGQKYEHRRGNTYIPPGGTAVRLSRYVFSFTPRSFL
jgi:translation initiation factor eIF-2B subunit epsilon